MRRTAVFSVLLACSLNAFAAEPQPTEANASDEDETEFRSPDGLFGLQIVEDPETSRKDRVVLVEWATKRVLEVLSDPERPEYAHRARLDWSSDSKRVAAFTATKVDGSIRILAREGDGFVEVGLPELPELPDLENPSPAFRKKHKFKFLKWIDTGTLEFVRWRENGDLEVRYHNLAATKDGGGFGSEILATIGIDAKHRATLKKVVRKEVRQ